MLLKIPRYNKYGNQQTCIDGRYFSSKLEASVYSLLMLEQKCKAIGDVRCQVNVIMRLPGGDTVRIIPDFSFYDYALNEQVFAEAKGVETDKWILKRKIWKAGFGPGKMRVYKGSYKNPYIHEILVPFTEE